MKVKAGTLIKVIGISTVSIPEGKKYENFDKEFLLGNNYNVIQSGTSGSLVLCRAADHSFYFSVDESEIESVNKVYIAGPITGIKNDNIEEFSKAHLFLENLGYEVVNPQCLPHLKAKKLEIEKAPYDEIWAAYLEEDLIEAVKCNSIALLQGWEKSKGARLEAFTLSMLGKEIYCINGTFSKIELKHNLIIKEKND